MIRLLGILTLLAAPAGAFPYDQFQRSTLHDIAGELAKQVSGTPNAPGSLTILANLQRNVVHVVYSGEHRPADAAVRTFIAKYEMSVQAQTSLAALYEDEYRFSENGKDYWLPVQSSVAAYFARELKPGDTVDLYLIAEGGVEETGGWRWILTVEEFRH